MKKKLHKANKQSLFITAALFIAISSAILVGWKLSVYHSAWWVLQWELKTNLAVDIYDEVVGAHTTSGSGASVYKPQDWQTYGYSSQVTVDEEDQTPDWKKFSNSATFNKHSGFSSTYVASSWVRINGDGSSTRSMAATKQSGTSVYTGTGASVW